MYQPITISSLESLPRDDVLFKLLLPKLDVKDWLSLHQTSKTFSNILDAFFVVNKYLRVSDAHTLSAQTFCRMSHSATNLRSLIVHSCHWMTDALLKPVLKNNPKLEILDITDCIHCTSTTLQVLTVNCPNISCLVLRGCTWVEPTAVDYFSNHRNSRKKADDMENVLMTMGKGLRTNLKRRTKAKYRGKDHLFESLQMQRRENVKRSPAKLNIGNLRFKPVTVLDLHGCGNITNDNIETLTTVFKQLEVLRIGNNSDISDEAMRSIALNLKFLLKLDISCCSSVTDAGLFTVTKHCSKLRQVDIEESQFTPEILNLLEEKNIRFNQVRSSGAGANLCNNSWRNPPTNLAKTTSEKEDCFDGIVLGMQ